MDHSILFQHLHMINDRGIRYSCDAHAVRDPYSKSKVRGYLTFRSRAADRLHVRYEGKVR